MSVTLQARCGVERCGASRTGYFTYNLVVTINGVDRTTPYIERETVRITLARNGEPASATFMVARNAVFTPTAGQIVVIAIGSASNPIFTGQILDIEHQRDADMIASERPDYVITCGATTKLFDRRRITKNFSGWTGTAIGQYIVANHTSGFYDYGIESGLPVLDEFICINESPTSAFTRLGNILGGGSLCGDERRIVHLWSSAARTSPWAPTDPITLTNSLSSLRAFTPGYDWSQLRTKIAVEGKSVPTPVAIPAGQTTIDYLLLPYEGLDIFNALTEVQGNFVRIGTTIFEYDYCDYVLGPPSAVVTADAAAGDPSVQVDDNTAIGPAGWLTDGKGHFFKFANQVTSILIDVPWPAGGQTFGSLTIDLATGTPLYKVHSLVNAVPLTLTGTVESDIAEGEAMVVRMETTDSSYTTAAAATEDGDGVHEEVVPDGDLTYQGCLERATAELATFGSALVRARWITRDMNAKPGAKQVLNLSSPDAVTGTLTIDNVVIEFPYFNHERPVRTCEGSTVKLETILDAIKR